jgi:GT2 family glycosyltransferase
VTTNASVTAILVGYDGPPAVLLRAIESLQAQSVPPRQIICVDQSVDARFERELQASDSTVEVLRLYENIGYPSACNVAARRAIGDYLLFMNPDATAHEECVEHLVSALISRADVAIAGAQVLLPNDRLVNAGDNALHLSGLSWAGRYGQPAEHGAPRPAAVVSGAALLVRVTAFEAIGAYTEGFFMYYDDADLAWRARLAGWEVLFCPNAEVTHQYEFEKGDYKWRYLERNRWWCLLTLLELRTLVLLAPLLCAVECAIWLRAGSEGWLPAKRAAWRMLWTDRHALRRRRRQIQSSRRIGDRAIIERMSADVDSPFLSTAAIRRLEPVLRTYRAVVLSIAR